MRPLFALHPSPGIVLARLGCHMLRQPISFRILAAIAGGTFVLTMLGLEIMHVPTPRGAADDWRRTAGGWERTSAWDLPMSEHGYRVIHSASNARLKGFGPIRGIHPLTLAAGEFFAALVAIAAYNRPFWTAARWSLKRGLAIVYKSFRASAFG